MRQIRTPVAAAIAGLGALALLATPSFAARDCTRPACINLKITLANQEPSTHDPELPFGFMSGNQRQSAIPLGLIHVQGGRHAKSQAIKSIIEEQGFLL